MKAKDGSDARYEERNRAGAAEVHLDGLRRAHEITGPYKWTYFWRRNEEVAERQTRQVTA
jgi:hypothetical protein